MRKRVLMIMLLSTAFILLSSSINLSQTVPGPREEGDLYPLTSEPYKGIVAANIGDGDDSDELVIDFGSNGVWVYQAAGYGAWAQISGNNPDRIIGAKLAGIDYEIVADFGSLGLFHWNYTTFPGLWVKISNGNAENIIAVDDDQDGYDEVYADFGTSGTWRWDYVDGWTKVSKGNPSAAYQSDFWTPGWQEANFDYGSSGLWNVFFDSVFPGTFYWERLNKYDIDDDVASAEIGVGGAAEELIVDFGSSGLWVLDENVSTWNRIHKSTPYSIRAVRFEGASDYELLAMFGVGGLYWWNYSGYPGVWTQISGNRPEHFDIGGGFCEPFDPNGLSEANNDEEVAVDFGVNGLWLYDYSTNNWTQLRTWDPKHMVRADIYNDGKKVCLIVDFQALGLYMYDGFLNSWTQINTLSPDN